MAEPTGDDKAKPSHEEAVTSHDPQPLHTQLLESAQNNEKGKVDLAGVKKKIKQNYEVKQAEYREKVKTMKPEDAAKLMDDLDAAFQITYGPLMLEEVQTDDKKQKELSARTQHRLADSIISTNLPNASDEYVRSMYRKVATLTHLCNSDIGIEEDLLSFWNGVRAEIGVMKALHPKYMVFIPDPSRGSSEVREWDVNQDVDFIAIPWDDADDKILLVNAQGALRDPRLGRHEQRSSVTVDHAPTSADAFTHPSFQRFFEEQNIKNKRFIRTIITVPTSSVLLGSMTNTKLGGPIPPVEDCKKSLDSFGTLTSALSESIITQTDTL